MIHKICLWCSESGLRLVATSRTRHDGSITDVHTGLLGDPNLVQTSSTDGTVRTWDLRTQDSVEKFSLGHIPVHSCTCNGRFVAAGVGEKVVLWERTTKKIVTTFEDTHALDVLQIKFNPSYPNALVSGSEEGNLNVFDLTSTIDEVESFVGALNLNTALAKFGYFENDHSKAWCLSGTETVHWWDWKGSCDPQSQVGAGVFAESLTAREALRIGHEPSDYIIDCYFNPASQSLFTIAGDISGTMVVYPCHHVPPADIVFSSQPSQVLQGGHSDIVRAALVPNFGGHNTGDFIHTIFSGGEDGRVCCWSEAAASNQPGAGKSKPPVSRPRVGPY